MKPIKSEKPASPDHYDLQEIVNEIIQKMDAAEVSAPPQKPAKMILARDFRSVWTLWAMISVKHFGSRDISGALPCPGPLRFLRMARRNEPAEAPASA